jgi:elongation factor 2
MLAELNQIMPRFRQTSEILKMMDKKESIRNIGIIAHIDHGKTTMTDSLLVEAGLLPPQVAGSARVLDYLEEEQKRGITIKTANISLLYEIDGRSYVINLVDTPGHVDFTGKVARALRAIDGAVVVVDAVEEIMAQTETVTRQALEERVKPVLFINKVDRLIEEMRLSNVEIQTKFKRIINDFNNLIEIYGEQEYKPGWKVDPTRESVAFGSALHRWGFTLSIANTKEIKFSNIMDAYKKEKHQILSQLIPLHTAILDMVVKSIPNPIESQKYRAPRIWKGEVNSEIGQAMLNCDDKGPTVMCITMAQMVPNIGLVATGRLFSGSVRKGDLVYLVGIGKEYSVQQVSVYMSAFRDVVDQVSAGNIAALVGLESARAGETLIDVPHKNAMVPFERIGYVSEPIMTIAVEPKNPEDLPSLVEVMDRLSLEDPNLVTTIDEETGQYLISGMGELHLEIAVNSLKQYSRHMDLTTSNPIIAYREAVLKQGAVVMTRSSNKHNKFWMQVEPLENGVMELVDKSGFTEEIEQKQGFNAILEESGNIWALDKYKNMLVDSTKNVQNLHEARDSIISGFHWACKTGPMCEQPLRGVKIKLVDAQLASDPVQREPAQITRAVSRAILGSCLMAEPVLLEPIYKIEVTVSTQWFGTCASIITRRRGKVNTTKQKGALTIITGCIPVAETLSLSSEMRSATSGHAFWQSTFDHWEKIPESTATELIKQVRERRGLPTEIPKPEKFIDDA